MLCLCGCGLETETSNRTIRARGVRKGEPLHYRVGHAGGAVRRRRRLTPELWTISSDGCWIWNGSRWNSEGHCAVWMNGKRLLAHRAVYEQEIGPIPHGLVLDHLCKRPPCVNPLHLEPVTPATNVRRSRATKLTPEQVEQIRLSPLSCRRAALEFGVSHQTISDIRRGHSWTAV